MLSVYLNLVKMSHSRKLLVAATCVGNPMNHRGDEF